MNKFLIPASLLFILSNSFAIKIPENLKAKPELLEDFKRLNNFKMPKDYLTFMYTEEFAKIVNASNKKRELEDRYNLKLSKASKILKPETLAIGLSIKERTPETKTKFAEYTCALHLFVPNHDDYNLPPGDFGSWRGYQNLYNDLYEVLPGGIEYDYMIDYTMRSFIAETKLEGREDGYGGGSIVLYKFKINAFPGITYLEYQTACYHMPKKNEEESIWLEKKSGPDYHETHYEPPNQKYFYHFPIPPEIINKSCKYIQKDIMNFNWNHFGEMDNPNYTSYGSFGTSEQEYSCN